MNASSEPARTWDHRARATAVVLGLGAFLANFDVTAVVVAMPAIGRDLGMGVTALPWVITAYSLAFTGALLAAGALADRFGRRRALLLGNVLFLVASLACGLAPDALSLCLARAVKGIGSAFVVTGAIASVATAFPMPETRTRAFAVVGVLSGVAMALGPTLGGAVAAWFGWRWIFLANLPACALLALTVPRLVAESRDGSGRPLDWAGVFLLTLALGLAIEALLHAREASLRLLLGLAGSASLLVLFTVREHRRERPMLDPAAFGSRSMAGVAALLVAVSVGYWAVLAYLPPFLGAAFGWDAKAVGLALLAATLPMLALPALGGRLVPRWGWRRFFAVALATIAAGGAALAAAASVGDASLALVLAVLGMVAIGTGAALSHPQLSGAVVALAPPDAAGMASAMTVVARQGGFALGVAALGAAVSPGSGSAGFIVPFTLAVTASVLGLAACALLPPRISGSNLGG